MNPGGSRHHETRQYFIKHNTLVDMLALMQRENELLDMIHAAISEQGWVEDKKCFIEPYFFQSIVWTFKEGAHRHTVTHCRRRQSWQAKCTCPQNPIKRVSHILKKEQMQAEKRHTAITDEAQLLDAQLHDMVNNQRLYNKTVLDMQTVGWLQCDYVIEFIFTGNQAQRTTAEPYAQINRHFLDTLQWIILQ